MAPLTTKQKFDYILTVLGTCTELKPDYNQVAAITGMGSANKAQKKFKKLVEETGEFKLSSGKVIPAGADVNPDPPAAKTDVSQGSANKTKTKIAETKPEPSTPSKKRKMAQADVDSEVEDEEV